MANSACTGKPNVRYYKSTESMERFGQVQKWLNFYCKKYVQSDAPTKENLCKLLIWFMDLQEKILGKNGSDTSIMRIPMHCFLDFRLGGSLCHILASIYRYKSDQSLKGLAFDATNITNKSYIEMSKHVFQNLIEHMHIRLPAVFIRPECDDKLREQINGVLKGLRCEIVDNQNEASHIIFPELDRSTEDYTRPLFKRGRDVMMHWYYLPDSYDSWLYNRRFILPDELPESINIPLRTWSVSADWLFDSKEFNEWMNEQDYEVDETGKRLFHPQRMTIENFFDEKKTCAATSHQNQKQSQPKELSRKRKSTDEIKNKRSRRKTRIAIEPKIDPPTLSQTYAAPASIAAAPISHSYAAPAESVNEPAIGKKPREKLVLSRTNCLLCGKEIAQLGLNRHMKELHSNVQLECSICGDTFKRPASLYDHQRRQHLEPVTKGRPKKGEKKQRARSPFRMDNFETRHSSSLQMNLKLQEDVQINCDKLNDMEKVLEEAKIDNQKNQKKIDVLEASKKQSEIEISKVKARVTFIESKQQQKPLPSVTDIPALLDYLCLDQNSTKEDIRKTIGLRLMETSIESSLSAEVYTIKNLSNDEKLKLSMFYNEACEVLLKNLDKKKK